MGDVLRWLATREDGPWRAWVEAPPGPAPPERVACDDLRVTYVNHSTFLVQTAGLNVLTDPIWSRRASPLRRIGPKRHRPPGLRFEDLPPIDLAIVSHDHYDHMDVPTLRRLSREHGTRVVVGLGNARMLARKGIDRVDELDWWQALDVAPDVRLHAVQVQHWSQRGLFDRDRTLWVGYVLETPCGSIYFAGDTGFGPHFAEVGRRHGPFRLAMIPIGAYLPKWIMAASHIGPEEALDAARLLRAETSVAMHHRCFDLADDGELEAGNELWRRATPMGRASFWSLPEGKGAWVP